MVLYHARRLHTLVYGHSPASCWCPEWFYLDELIATTYLPGWVTLPTLIMTLCMLPYLTLIVLDTRLRPKAPRQHVEDLPRPQLRLVDCHLADHVLHVSRTSARCAGTPCWASAS